MNKPTKEEKQALLKLQQQAKFELLRIIRNKRPSHDQA